MSLPVELQPIAKYLNSRIAAHPIAEASFRHRRPQWAGRLLTSLLVAVDSRSAADVEYVSCASGDDGFRVLVMTPKFIVMGSVSTPDKDSSDFSVKVAKRSGVSSVNFSHTGSALGVETYEPWPGAPTFTVTHEELGEVSFPLGDDYVDNDDSTQRETVLKTILQELKA